MAEFAILCNANLTGKENSVDANVVAFGVNLCVVFRYHCSDIRKKQQQQ